MSPAVTEQLRLALPKGRMEAGVLDLLRAAGIEVKAGSRTYRPSISLPEFEAKLLKPKDIILMLKQGSRDVGFAGADWVRELKIELVELLDTGLDPVRLVVAAPCGLLINNTLPRDRELIIASEYTELAKSWIAKEKLNAKVLTCCGATEVFPPEDADCIIDNTASGATLRANQLEIVDELLVSSTRLYASPQALKNPIKKKQIEDLVILLASVVDARQRLMLELNVSADKLKSVCLILPCMREPTVSTLLGGQDFAVKAAVPKSDLPRLIPLIKEAGGSDIVVSNISQIIP